MVVGLVLLLAACGTQKADFVIEEGQEVPAHIGQALAVVLALSNAGVQQQVNEDVWVTTTLLQTPEGTPALWANIKTKQKVSFEDAIRTAEPTQKVYLTGARTDRAFYGDVFPARVFQKLYEACPTGCRLVYQDHQIYAVKGDTWTKPSGEALKAVDIQKERNRYSRVKESVYKSDLPQEMAKRWKRLMDESQIPPSLSSQAVTDPFNPVPMNIRTEFFRPTGQVAPQTHLINECRRWFFWSCTVRERTGMVDNFGRGYDFGNKQSVALPSQDYWDGWDWSSQPLQYYQAPLNAPFQYGTNTTWGLWDAGNAGLLGKGSTHLTGCGPTSLLRILNWYRTAGLLNNGNRQVTLRLPNDDLTYSGTSVTVGNNSSDYWQTSNFVRMAFWPVKVGNNGKDVYNAWISRRMNGHWFVSGQMVLPKDFSYFGNVWLSENNFTPRIEGHILRDLDWGSVIGNVVPVISWFHYTQYTWRVNGLLKDTTGTENVPAIAVYPAGGASVHYGIARGYRTLEMWDYAQNWAVVDENMERIWNWPDQEMLVEPYLSDFWSTTSGAYRLR